MKSIISCVGVYLTLYITIGLSTCFAQADLELVAFADLNANGLFDEDPSTFGLVGVSMHVYVESTNLQVILTTDAVSGPNGLAMVRDLPDGIYHVVLQEDDLPPELQYVKTTSYIFQVVVAGGVASPERVSFGWQLDFYFGVEFCGPLILEATVPEFTLDKDAVFEPASAASGVVSLDGSCVPDAVSTAPWIQLMLEPGQVGYVLEANPDPDIRVARIPVGGESFVIVQHGTTPIIPQVGNTRMRFDLGSPRAEFEVDALDDRPYRIESTTNLVSGTWTFRRSGTGGLPPISESFFFTGEQAEFFRVKWE